MLLRVVVSEMQRAEVRVEQRALLGELLADHLAKDIHVDVEQSDEGARVGDVAHQRPLAIAGKRVDAKAAKRHAEDRDVLAGKRLVERPGRIVEEPAAAPNGGHVLRVCGRIQGDNEIDVGRARGMAVLADADLVPRRQALDVRGEDVLARDRNPHAENGLHEQPIGAGGAGAVYGSDLECEVVDHVNAFY